MSKDKAKISLTTPNGVLTLPLRNAIWKLWRITTYPLVIFAGYIFFGIEGAVFCTILTILTFRGEL